MKLRKTLFIAAMSSLMLAQLTSPVLVIAESIPDQQLLTAQGHSEVSGRYTTRFEKQELVLTFAPDASFLATETLQSLHLELSKNGEVKNLPFSQTQAGLYEVRLSTSLLQDQPDLAIQLTTASQEEYRFDKVSYDLASAEAWSTELVQTTDLTTTTVTSTSSQTTESTTTAILDEPTTTASQTTSQEVPASGQQLPEAQPTKTNVSLKAQEGNGKFDIAVTNLVRPNEISSVLAAVWSEKNGQDDLKWYPMTVSQSSAKLTVEIKHHGNQTDQYLVHVYINYKSSPTIGIDAGKISITKPISKHQLDAKWTDQGLDVALTSNQVSDFTKVKLAVWGEKNGQDDLNWYSASTAGRLSIPYSRLAGFDQYQIHAYLEENGKMQGLTTATISLKQPQFTTSVTKLSNAQYKLTIQNLPAYVTSLQIPVWSDKNGQDDLNWYTASKKSAGVFELVVPLSNHKFDTGTYQAHLYAGTPFSKDALGIGVVKDFTVSSLGNPSASVRIANVNSQTLQFDVIVSDVVAPGGLASVQVPVWSDVNGQDDLQWYTASKQADGSYKVTVSLDNHKYSFGRYQAHAYLKLANGQMAGVGTTSVQFNQPANVTRIEASYQGMGNYQLTFRPVLTAGRVKYAVWSEVGGQDDLRWYEASRLQSVVFGGGLNAQLHSGTGRYQIHAYEEVNGQLRGLTTTTVHVNKAHYQAPYYSQLDPRWSGIRYGAWTFGPSGCVPTSMAMIISAITDQTISPVQVANYLHYHTLEYNRSFFGTSSRGVVMAARNWGLKAQALNSYADLENALKQGYYVAAGVGPSRYIISGGHEIVLKGFQNGMTYVLDPYNPGNNGWTSLAYIWSIPSTDPIDRTEGMPYIRISD